MIRKAAQMETEVRNIRNGIGNVTVQHLFKKEEITARTRMCSRLTLPPGVSVVGEQTVHVQVGIAAIEGSLSLSGIPVEVIGLAPGLGAQISPGTVDVILTGPLPLLDKLTPGDIRFVVDLTGLESGTHQATPQPQILITDIRVQSLNPGTIEVVIGLIGPSTPTPTATLTPAATLLPIHTPTRNP